MSKLWPLDMNHIHSVDVGLIHLQIPRSPCQGQESYGTLATLGII